MRMMESSLRHTEPIPHTRAVPPASYIKSTFLSLHIANSHNCHPGTSLTACESCNQRVSSQLNAEMELPLFPASPLFFHSGIFNASPPSPLSIKLTCQCSSFTEPSRHFRYHSTKPNNKDIRSHVRHQESRPRLTHPHLCCPTHGFPNIDAEICRQRDEAA